MPIRALIATRKKHFEINYASTNSWANDLHRMRLYECVLLTKETPRFQDFRDGNINDYTTKLLKTIFSGHIISKPDALHA
jgi:hypothetical protein